MVFKGPKSILFYNRCRLCIKEVVPFLTVDVIDYRSKNRNIADENDCHSNQENIDLLTEHKENGILFKLYIYFTFYETVL